MTNSASTWTCPTCGERLRSAALLELLSEHLADLINDK